MKSIKGQGAVEALICMPLLALFISGLGIMSYRALIFHVAQYHLHEALICQQSVSKNICIDEARQRLSAILIGSNFLEISIYGTSRKKTALAKIGLSPIMKIEKTLELR